MVLPNVEGTLTRAGSGPSERQNGWWLTGLSASYQIYPELAADKLVGYRAVIEGLTPQAIRDAARKYLDTENYIRVTLLPETTPATH